MPALERTDKTFINTRSEVIAVLAEDHRTWIKLDSGSAVIAVLDEDHMT